jgi:Trypsin-like peptidase domain
MATKTIGSKLDNKIFGHLVYVKNEETQEFGTGTLIKNKDKWYVLTASHVIKNAVASKIYMNIGIEYGSKLERATIIADNPNLDYALIEIDGSEANLKLGLKNTPYEFNVVEKVAEKPNLDRIVITGFPNLLVEDKNKELPERNYFSLWEKMPTDKEYWPDRLKNEVDDKLFMLIDFHPERTAPFQDKDGKPVKIFAFHGMSGGPVWIFDRATTEGPVLKYGLYGVFTSYYPLEKLWKFTRMDAVLENAKTQFGIDLINR